MDFVCEFGQSSGFLVSGTTPAKTLGKWNLHYHKKFGDPVLVRMLQFKKEVKMTVLEKAETCFFQLYTRWFECLWALCFKPFVLCAWFLSNFLCAAIQNVYTLAEKCHKLMLSFWSRWLSMKRRENEDRGQGARWETRVFRTCNFVWKRAFAMTATVGTYWLTSSFRPSWQGR